MKRWLPAIALILAGIPLVRWYAARMQDGGETAGLVPLLIAAFYIFRDRRKLISTPKERTIGIVALLLYAAAFPFLPSLPFSYPLVTRST